MSIPIHNTETIESRIFSGAIAALNQNLARVPHPVDVTGMEFAISLSVTEAAASASIHTVTIVDGGATGDAVATTAVLFATQTNGPSSGTGWTANSPKKSNGTSATDLDADDYINVVPTTAGTASSGLTVMASYVYGIPGGVAN